MQFEILHPRDLADADAASWRSLARAHPDTSTPFLGPDYARLVADCGGPDAARARVLVIREKGEAVGFMAYRKGRLGACAIGAPFTDYPGLVAAPGLGLTPEQLVGALKVGRLDFTGVPSTQALFCDHFREHDESLLALLPDGYEAFAKDRKAVIRTTVLNHIDSETEEETERDKEGHVLRAAKVADQATGKAFSWEMRKHGGTLDPESLLSLVEAGTIERSTYLAMTTQVRVVDEKKVMLELKKHPELIDALGEAITKTGQTGALNLREVK